MMYQITINYSWIASGAGFIAGASGNFIVIVLAAFVVILAGIELLTNDWIFSGLMFTLGVTVGANIGIWINH